MKKGHNYGLCKKCGKNHGPHPRLGMHNSEEMKKKASKSLKGRTAWNEGLTKETDERVRKMAEKQRGKKLSEEVKLKIGKSHTGKKHTEETKRKISKSKTGKKHTIESRRKMFESRVNYLKTHPEEHTRLCLINKGRNFTEKHRENLRIVRLRQIFPTKDSSIEIKIQNELNSRGIEYKKHIPVCNICQPDILFPEKKIAIFCDGDYWHSKEFDNGNRWKRDRRNDKILKESGWVTLRFWGYEINTNPSLCVDRIEGVLNSN